MCAVSHPQGSNDIRKMATLVDGAGDVDLNSAPDLTSVWPENHLGLDPELEPQEVRQAIADARDWLAGFKWCSQVVRSFWGWGIPPTLSVCLFEIEPTTSQVDRWLRVRGLGGLEGNLQVHYFENAVIGVRVGFHSRLK
jgi:hypothetical protein